jgi:hypothetical protein
MGKIMNQADKDAQKWMEANSKWQYRELIKAKETGQPYYINQHGTVIIEKDKNEPKTS